MEFKLSIQNQKELNQCLFTGFIPVFPTVILITTFPTMKQVYSLLSRCSVGYKSKMSVLLINFLRSFIATLIFCLPDKQGFQVYYQRMYSASFLASPTSICKSYCSQPTSEQYSMQHKHLYLKHLSPIFLAKRIIASLALQVYIARPKKEGQNKQGPLTFSSYSNPK